jgi:hypothetical protein
MRRPCYWCGICRDMYNVVYDTRLHCTALGQQKRASVLGTGLLTACVPIAGAHHGQVVTSTGRGAGSITRAGSCPRWP